VVLEPGELLGVGPEAVGPELVEDRGQEDRVVEVVGPA
jgi:hypothetical protein